jgi:hypothetical protein
LFRFAGKSNQKGGRFSAVNSGCRMCLHGNIYNVRQYFNTIVVRLWRKGYEAVFYGVFAFYGSSNNMHSRFCHRAFFPTLQAILRIKKQVGLIIKNKNARLFKHAFFC